MGELRVVAEPGCKGAKFSIWAGKSGEALISHHDVPLPLMAIDDWSCDGILPARAS